MATEANFSALVAFLGSSLFGHRVCDLAIFMCSHVSGGVDAVGHQDEWIKSICNTLWRNEIYTPDALIGIKVEDIAEPGVAGDVILAFSHLAARIQPPGGVGAAGGSKDSVGVCCLAASRRVVSSSIGLYPEVALGSEAGSDRVSAV